MLLKSVNGHTPIYGSGCYFAENATLVGDVVMGKNCSVWFQAVIRGDVNSIRIGDQVNIQDGAVLHATYKTAPTVIGNEVSIGHNAIVHGCHIGDQVLIGMGSIVMDHCIIEPDSIIAAGAVVPKNTIVRSGSVFGGIPAKHIKNVSPELLRDEIQRIALSYKMYASWFMEP